MSLKAGLTATDKRKQKRALIDLLKKNPIVEIACKKVGISRATFYRWQQKDVKFRSQIKEALEISRESVNDLAESKLIEQINGSSFKAIQFWLINNHKKYRPRKGNQLPTDDDELSPAEEKMLERAMLNAGIIKRKKD